METRKPINTGFSSIRARGEVGVERQTSRQMLCGDAIAGE